MEHSFHCIRREFFTQDHKGTVASLLKKQGKVRGDYNKKAERCYLICIALNDKNIPIAMGAIKPTTTSVFSKYKADMHYLVDQVEYELGYFYTEPEYCGRGIAKNIFFELFIEFQDKKLMATTEATNTSMIKILLNNGFKKVGKSWLSIISQEQLNLYINFQNG